MTLRELYQQIKNPLDDSNTFRRLLFLYANHDNFYHSLTHVSNKQYKRGEYYSSDSDRFYSLLFNKWKNNIVSVTKDEYIKMYQRGILGSDFVILRNYLKYVPDIYTKEQADAILNSSMADKDLEASIQRYRWDNFGKYSSWNHICSKYLTAYKDAYQKVEHRLYLNPESVDQYQLYSYFIQKCDEHHLPYYFKFSQYANRDDTMVIYSSTEHLAKYVDILREIQKEHPDLISRMKNPPLVTGKIDGWIGYGSEPYTLPDEDNKSYHEVRSDILESSIRKVTGDWICNHSSIPVEYHNKKYSFQDYFSIRTTEHIIGNLESRYQSLEQSRKNSAKNRHEPYNPSSIIDTLGYSLDDLHSTSFRNLLFHNLRNSISSNFSNICNNRYIAPITMNVRNNKTINCTYNDMESVIAKMVPLIERYDPKFISDIKSEISRQAQKQGIDTTKFCFDVERVKSMLKLSKEQKQIRDSYYYRSNELNQMIDIYHSTVLPSSLVQKK